MISASEKNEFRLATLLRVRVSTRDECRVLLAEAHRADDALARYQDQLGAEQNHIQEDCREAAAPGAVDVEHLANADRYAAWLQTRILDLSEQRRALAEEIERRRLSLVAADQEVQILEKLQERRQRSRRLEDERKQSKQLDEVALLAVPASLAGTRGATIASGIASSW
jgi:flagellar export protein FliJ